MKLDFRVSVRKMICVELAIAALFFLLAILFPASYDATVYIVGFCLVHIAAYSPIGFSRGFDFIMHDHPPDSFLGLYHFLCIAIATTIGILLTGPIAAIADQVRSILIG